MLPAELLHVRATPEGAVPLWLGDEDGAWLRALLDDFERLAGRPQREVTAFLAEPPAAPAPMAKRRMAVATLRALCALEPLTVDVAALRAALVVAAQRARDAGRFERGAVLAEVAPTFGLTATEAEDALFSDVPAERRLRLPAPLPDPHALAVATNLALGQGLVRAASHVTLALYGSARPVLRQIALQRLLVQIRRAPEDGVRLEVSGPFALFRHTTIYGRALASVVPFLGWCDRFELVARARLRGKPVDVHLRHGDPLALGEPPRRYDSKLEERFAKDFAKATLAWDLVREPAPIEAEDALVFPDFEAVNRADRRVRVLVEIVGFWTAEYLGAKLRRLAAVRTPLVLCIDRSKNCGQADLPPNAQVVWFEKKIAPQDVLAAIARLERGATQR